MINKVNLIETLEHRLKKIGAGTCIDIRSYKRDRKILVIKKGEDELLVIEDGFNSQTLHHPLFHFEKIDENTH